MARCTCWFRWRSVAVLLPRLFCRVVPFAPVKAVAISTRLAVLQCHKPARCQQFQLRPAAAQLSPALQSNRNPVLQAAADSGSAILALHRTGLPLAFWHS